MHFHFNRLRYCYQLGEFSLKSSWPIQFRWFSLFVPKIVGFHITVFTTSTQPFPAASPQLAKTCLIIFIHRSWKLHATYLQLTLQIAFQWLIIISWAHSKFWFFTHKMSHPSCCDTGLSIWRHFSIAAARFNSLTPPRFQRISFKGFMSYFKVIVGSHLVPKVLDIPHYLNTDLNHL